MTILHTTETARLGELLAVGRGLLLRYGDLRERMNGALAAQVDAIDAARAPARPRRGRDPAAR
jgi:hypothetical protein